MDDLLKNLKKKKASFDRTFALRDVSKRHMLKSHIRNIVLELYQTQTWRAKSLQS